MEVCCWNSEVFMQGKSKPSYKPDSGSEIVYFLQLMLPQLASASSYHRFSQVVLSIPGHCHGPLYAEDRRAGLGNREEDLSELLNCRSQHTATSSFSIMASVNCFQVCLHIMTEAGNIGQGSQRLVSHWKWSEPLCLTSGAVILFVRLCTGTVKAK